MENSIRSRNWCFTLNNWTEKDRGRLMSMYENKFCRYLVFGHEIAESGTHHLQGYVNFPGPLSLRQLTKPFPKCHWEAMKGTPLQASDYCKKQDPVYIELGTLPDRKRKPSKTSELVLKAIKEGKKVEQLREMFPSFMLYHQPKVEKWITYQNSKTSTFPSFYRLHDSDPITRLTELHPKLKFIVIHELAEIEAYSDYHTVLFIPEFFETKYNSFPRNNKILYKFGFEYKVLQCKNFIIACPPKNSLRFNIDQEWYKNIKLSDLNIYETQEERIEEASHTSLSF